MTADNVEFKEWPKIPRGQDEIITITEKMDGTNAAIIIENDRIIGCQSRKRLISPGDDNFGFALWVEEHREEILSLGDGYHYGEWVGPGIQKNPHGLTERELFLFNATRWNPSNPNRPACCNVVPVVYEGLKMEDTIKDSMEAVREVYIERNIAADLDQDDAGWMEPEGVIVWYHKTRRFEKHTFKMPEGKWQS